MFFSRKLIIFVANYNLILMKKKILPILLLCASCVSSNVKEESGVFSDMEVDFPVADTIIFTPKQSFEIISDVNHFFVNDSVLFAFENNLDNFGYCYDKNSGKKISVMLGRGNAGYEMQNRLSFGNLIFGDSIQFIDNQNGIIKSFALNDVLTKPIGDRGYSISMPPSSTSSVSFRKIGAGNMFGTYNGFMDESNFRYFIQNGDEIAAFGEFRKDLFISEQELTNSVMKSVLNNIHILSDNDKIVTSSFSGVLLQVIDGVKKTVDFERYYNKINLSYTISDDNYAVSSKSITTYSTIALGSNDKNIFCFIVNSYREKSSKKRINDYSLLVFDWKLNPVKKFNLGNTGFFSLSTDCKSFYRFDKMDDRYVLMEGKINL